jgi:O-antigen/teichoic acid export membrane protein
MSSVAYRAQLLMAHVPRPAVWSKWVRGSICSVLDQALVSTSNFILGVALARWLTPVGYGEYALGFSLFLLSSLFYQAVILEPISVYGAGTFRDHFREYLGSLIRVHAVIGGTGASALVIAVIVLSARGHYSLAKTLLGVAVATPSILLLWLSRRAALVQHPGYHVAAASLVYTIIVLGGSYEFHTIWPLTAATAFVWMGAGAMATSIVQLYRLRPVLRTRQKYANVNCVWRSHWGYGRWAILTALAQWVSANSYYFVLSGSHSMILSGHLRALMNLALPIGQTMTALMWVVQPQAVRILEKHGVLKLKYVTIYISVAYAGAASLYWMVVLLLHGQILPLLYGSRYPELRYWLSGLAVSSILQMLAQGVAVGLRAMDLPSAISRASVFSAVTTLLVGVPAVILFQVRGAIAGMIAANCIGLLAHAVLLGRNIDARRSLACAY